MLRYHNIFLKTNTIVKWFFITLPTSLTGRPTELLFRVSDPKLGVKGRALSRMSLRPTQLSKLPCLVRLSTGCQDCCALQAAPPSQQSQMLTFYNVTDQCHCLRIGDPKHVSLMKLGTGGCTTTAWLPQDDYAGLKWVTEQGRGVGLDSSDTRDQEEGYNHWKRSSHPRNAITAEEGGGEGKKGPTSPNRLQVLQSSGFIVAAFCLTLSPGDTRQSTASDLRLL